MPDFQDLFSVIKTDTNTYVGKHPLTKPHPSARGVYGGNLVCQSVVVAMKSVEKGFSPHSLHAYFVKAVTDKKPVTWNVIEVSNGKNFCNRSIHGLQDGEIRYIVNISLTKKNSLKEATKEYEDHLERERQKEAQAANSDDDDDDDDDNDEPVPEAPFHFQVPYPEWLKDADIDALPIDYKTRSRMLYHKIPKQLVSLEGTEFEEKLPATKRDMSFFVRLGNDDVKITDQDYQYAGLAVISDSIFSTRLARVLRIPGLDLSGASHYYSVSLDHTIYFHDVDFDCTDWMGFGFRSMGLVNGRFVLEGHMYNKNRQQVATVIQEGIARFNGLEKEAKL